MSSPGVCSTVRSSSISCSVIPCAFDRVYPVGGSFHCCTTDVRREGELRSYFPSLDAR